MQQWTEEKVSELEAMVRGMTDAEIADHLDAIVNGPQGSRRETVELLVEASRRLRERGEGRATTLPQFLS